MLTPTGNLQDWINNQNKQVRSESDIKIEVFSHSGGTCSLETTLTKQNIESYSISESNSILCFQTPMIDINFKVFKDGTTEYLIKQGYFIRISYGYKINNSWSWVEKGVYEISKAKVQNNGLTAEYQANFLRYGALESIFNYGIKEGGKSSSGIVLDICSFMRMFDNNLQFENDLSILVSDATGGTTLGNNRSCLDVLCSIAQANGCFLTIGGIIDSSNQYKLKFVFYRISNNTNTNDFVIEYKNMLKKPESIDSKYAYDGYEITERIETYSFDTYGQYYGDDVLVELENLPAQYVNSGFIEYNLPKYPFDNVKQGARVVDFYVYDNNGNDVSSQFENGNDAVFYNNGFILSCDSPIPSNYTVKVPYFSYFGISTNIISQSGSKKISINNPFVCARYNAYNESSPQSHNLRDRIRATVSYMANKEELEIECRFDTRAEIGDCIIVADTPNTYKLCIVEGYSMNYSGAYKGSMELVNLGNTAHYTITFSDMSGNVFNTQQNWGGLTPTVPECPAWTDSSNSVYKSKTFLDWTPSVSTPISADTDFYPIYDYESYYYDELTSYSGSGVVGQICAFTSEAISGDTRRWAYPHIAMITSLRGSKTIPAKAGAPTRYLSQLPTEIYGKPEYDEWQHNQVFIVKWGATSSQKYLIGVVRNNIITACLCKNSANNLYYGRPSSIYLPVLWDTFADLVASFDYDATNDCFTFNGSGTVYAGFYKRRTS